MIRSIFFILAGFIYCSSNSEACSCAERSIKENLEKSSAVIHGKISDVKEVTNVKTDIYGEVPIIVTFTVIDRFKGIDKDTTEVTLYTQKNRSSCNGLLGPTAVDSEWLVFASEASPAWRNQWMLYSNGRFKIPEILLTTSICAGTQYLDSSQFSDFGKLLLQIKGLLKNHQ